MPGHRYVEEIGLVAVMATKRPTGTTPEVNLVSSKIKKNLLISLNASTRQVVPTLLAESSHGPYFIFLYCFHLYFGRYTHRRILSMLLYLFFLFSLRN